MSVTPARQRRIDAGLTATEVAERIGVTATYIRLLETGERAPSHETYELLAQIYGDTLTPSVHRHRETMVDLLRQALDELAQLRRSVSALEDMLCERA